MLKTLISGAAVAVALATAGCGSSNDSTPTTQTVVQTVTETVATTRAEELTADDRVVIAAANLAAARYCTAALGHVVGDLPNPPSTAVIDRHINTANRFIEVLEAKPEAAGDAARELIRISRRCQSPVAGDVRGAMGR